MSPRLTRPQRQQQTRERLLDAAVEVFSRRGYHAASVEEISEAAGFSKGAVYSNFASKEELFLALLDRLFTRELPAWRADQLRYAVPAGEEKSEGPTFLE
ncbi:MAG TPA: helix-turn-helix domain-containing protein, partial [Caldilineaceae bacterium]|nr:helix-turn-helix domain-containing protein [Caldilineaceae bacterium]